MSQLPITIDIEELFYLKPEVDSLLISPADETPSDPCDAQPEEINVAICVYRIESAFALNIERIRSKWAGFSRLRMQLAFREARIKGVATPGSNIR